MKLSPLIIGSMTRAHRRSLLCPSTTRVEHSSRRTRLFEEQLLGLFAHFGADLVAEFEGVEELTPQLANRQWQAVEFGEEILKLLDNGLRRA